jgi:hypothetical protein
MMYVHISIQNKLRKVIRKIANENNITQEEVWEMWLSQFETIADIMGKADKDDFSTHKSFRLFNLGTFTPHEGKFNNIVKRRKLKLEREANDNNSINQV